MPSGQETAWVYSTPTDPHEGPQQKTLYVKLKHVVSGHATSHASNQSHKSSQ